MTTTPRTPEPSWVDEFRAVYRREQGPPPRPAALPAHLTPYGAKTHTVELAWRVRNPSRLVIGPEPLLVLAVRARRDVEILTWGVDYPKMGDRDAAGVVAEAVLAQVPHVTGKRRLRPEGEPWVYGQEDVLASAMFLSCRPDERAREPEQVRWWGGTVPAIEHNRNPAPCIWWAGRGRILVPKGASVGLIVRATAPTVCQARLGGV